MCLIAITEKYENPTDEIKVGYKWISRFGLSFWNGVYYGCGYKTDTWIKPDRRILINVATYNSEINKYEKTGESYLSGFHAFKDPEALEPENTTKVFVRKITYLGKNEAEKDIRHHPMDCYVAEEIYVPSTPDGLPPELREQNEPTTETSPQSFE